MVCAEGLKRKKNKMHQPIHKQWNIPISGTTAGRQRRRFIVARWNQCEKGGGPIIGRKAE